MSAAKMIKGRHSMPSLAVIAGLLAWAILFAPPSLGAPPPAPTLDQLKNLSYRGIAEQPIRLKDGVCDGAPVTPGGPPQPHVELVEGSRITGDLNGDGVEDAAVLLSVISGGSGESLYLALVLGNDDGAEIRNVATHLLGNRVKVRGMRVAEGSLVLDLIKAGPGDAACCPSLKVHTSFRLKDEALVENGREVQGRLSIADLPGTTWSLTRLGSKPLPEGVTVTLELEGDQVSGSAGCNRYFAGIKGNGPYDLAIGPPGATRRACSESVMAIESAFLAALQKVTQFSFLVGRLVLTYRLGDDQPVGSMIFSAEK